MKILNDKYYTPKNLAKELIDITFEVLTNECYSITDIIEPSAGSGSFSDQINCTAYDIEPESENIIKCDFLKEQIDYKKGRLCIGNPPFGNRNSLSIKFFKKCCNIGDYIAFIQPISQLDNNLQMYEFDLIYSKDLGVVPFSDRNLHCCFNIYVRPKNGVLNKKDNFKLKDVTIKEYRRNGNYKIDDGFDYSMCNWGNGSLGKVPKYVGEFAQEVYFYIHNEELKEEIIKSLEYNTIRNYVNSISSKRISVARLYKYLKYTIKGIK